jgi:hypothetical protein
VPLSQLPSLLLGYAAEPVIEPVPLGAVLSRRMCSAEKLSTDVSNSFSQYLHGAVFSFGAFLPGSIVAITKPVFSFTRRWLMMD